MRSGPRPLALAFIAMLALAGPVGAVPPEDPGPPPEDTTGTANLPLTGNSPRPVVATQTDLAFRGNIAIAGSNDGFRIVDITNPNKPVQIGRALCNGSQGDVSIYGDLVFRSVNSPQSSTDCNSTNVASVTPGQFEGIQIFDVSDLTAPVKIASVRTDCGSHTHTLVPDAENNQVFLYVSSYPLGAAQGPACQLPGGFISIVRVPLDNPTGATVSKYFLDPATQLGNYLGSIFTACHDISVFTAIDRAAAACMTEGQVWDISNPAAPRFLWRYDNPVINPANIDLFHSASFSWDGKIVAFGDESGGGGAARCVNPDDNQGRIWFVDAATGQELTSFKIPRSEIGRLHDAQLQLRAPAPRQLHPRCVLLHGRHDGRRRERPARGCERGRSGDRLAESRGRQQLVVVLVQRPHLRQRRPGPRRLRSPRRRPSLRSGLPYSNPQTQEILIQ